MKLYTYWRSTASYRVRIALALKGLKPEHVSVHLVRGGGEHRMAAYRAINPQERVPAVQLEDGSVIVQSLAILEYLEEAYPNPPLLPKNPVERARVRGVAGIICCDSHPLHNVGPLNYLRQNLHASEEQVSEWIAHWIGQGLAAVEAMIADDGFSFGKEPGLADICLLPQLYAARRFNVPLGAFARILRVEGLATEHDAFKVAHPSAQADAE
jgi:maleylacetoacetate isomerase